MQRATRKLVCLFAALALQSSALAVEGSLILPVHASDAVQLRMDGDDYTERDYSDSLQVFVGSQNSCCSNKIPMTGRYIKTDGWLRFLPLFDFASGQQYVVRVSRHTDGREDLQFSSFEIKSDAASTRAEVTRIYPSGDVLPENVLRFYIHFTKPMQPHIAHRYIKLVNASTEKPDKAAFMKFKQEIWSEDRKRLTVLMDPGRIKRNVITNVRLGPAMEAGSAYRLIIEEGWPSADGASFLSRFEKSFTVSNPIRERPNVPGWTLTPPELGTRESLKIDFDRAFDYQLLHTDIKVFSASGENIEGSISVENHETQWLFVPREDWTDKRISIVVDSKLEDIAGNNFRDLLDHTVDTEIKDDSSIRFPVDLVGSRR